MFDCCCFFESDKILYLHEDTLVKRRPYCISSVAPKTRWCETTVRTSLKSGISTNTPSATSVQTITVDAAKALHTGPLKMTPDCSHLA